MQTARKWGVRDAYAVQQGVELGWTQVKVRPRSGPEHPMTVAATH